MTRPTARGVALLAIAGGTYLAARIVGTWELYLLSFAFLAATLVSWLLVLATGRKLQVARSVKPERPTAGDPLVLSFRVESDSLLPGLQATLLHAAGDLSPRDRDIEVESLGSRTRRVVTSGPWPARRGVHHLPPLLAEAEDPLGLVRTRRRFSDTLDVTVFPRLVQLPSCLLFADMGAHRGGGGRRSPTLEASEFRGIRPYNAGEPLNRVDWKGTARTGRLMVREMDDPTNSDLAVLLDGHAQRVVGEPPETNFELAVQAAGSVADCALRAGHSVTLLLHERQWRQTRLSPDTKGRRRLLESLARATPRGASQLGSSLRTLFVNGLPLDRARTLVLVVLALDRELVRSLIALRDEGMRVSLIHVAAGSFAPAASTAASSAALAAESQGLMLALASAGVLGLTLDRGDDLLSALSLKRAQGRHAQVR